jgi:hypothetical protein
MGNILYCEYRFLPLLRTIPFRTNWPFRWPTPQIIRRFSMKPYSGQPLGTTRILMGFSSHPGTWTCPDCSRIVGEPSSEVTQLFDAFPPKNNVSTPTKTTWNCVFRSCWGYYTILYPNHLISMYIDSTEIFDRLVGFWVQATVYLSDPHVVCLRVSDWLERGSFPYWIVTPIRYSTTC